VSTNNTYSVYEQIVAISAYVGWVAQVDRTRKVTQVRRRFVAEQVGLQHVADELRHRPAGACRQLLQGVVLLGREVNWQALTSHDVMISR